MGFIIYLPPSQQHISCENEHVMHKSICISPRVNVRRANIYMHIDHGALMKIYVSLTFSLTS